MCHRGDRAPKAPMEILRAVPLAASRGGVLLLSTPNVSSKWSRAFGRRNMLAIGHIDPLSSHEIDYIASSTGFQLLQRIPVGRFLPPECASARDRLRHFVFSCFVILLR